jgi:release factor glutamine methyltransferase
LSAALRSMPPTIGEALAQATTTLLGASDSPQSDAVELLSRVLGTVRGDVQRLRDRALTKDQGDRLDAWLARRIAGEPVQYITGRAAFRDLDLEVKPAVLIPRPETEGLVEAALEVLRAEVGRWPKPRVLDLGTGSGAIALAIASEFPATSVVATDASEEALGVARRNTTACGMVDRVEFRLGDWFDVVGADERFEVIVSNPPYVGLGEAGALPRDVRDFEPPIALFSGPTGLEALREIIDESPRHLVAGGLLALELAESRAREVAGWLEGARDWSDVELRDDLSGQPRVLLARRERGPAIAPAQWGEER